MRRPAAIFDKAGVEAPRTPDRLDTDRLVLRRREVDDAVVFRQLWTERGPRVPPHRRVGPDGRPTLDDIAASIRLDRDHRNDEFLTIVRRHEGDVIGYCGLVSDGRGPPGEPDLAFVDTGRVETDAAHGETVVSVRVLSTDRL